LARRHFPEYRFGSEFMIAAQCEGATHLTGF
jgi:hypothetical protein